MPQADLEIRSEAVQEILIRTPSWLVRWGITLIFVLIVMFISLVWFIKYPDVIQGSTILTTQRPSVKLVTQVSGVINTLYVADNTWIHGASPITAIKNPVSEKAITYLRSFLCQVQQRLQAKLDFIMDLVTTSHVFGRYPG